MVVPTVGHLPRFPADALTGSFNGMLIGVMRIAFFAAVVALLGLWAAIARRGE